MEPVFRHKTNKKIIKKHTKKKKKEGNQNGMESKFYKVSNGRSEEQKYMTCRKYS